MKDLTTFGAVLFSCALLTCFGCGDDDKSESCMPGAGQFCPCPGGGLGAQSCNPDGKSWATCQCGSENNDPLSLLLTGHPSRETTDANSIEISGTAPDGRGDTGTIQITNNDQGPEGPLSISFSILDGSYSQEVDLATGENTITVTLLEGEQVVVTVTIVITSTYAVEETSGDAGADASVDADADTDGDTDADTDADTDIDSDADVDTGTEPDAGHDAGQDAGECVPEGDTVAVFPGAPPCCPGLTPLSPMTPPGCGPTVGASVCADCPNGTCGPGENYCNCPDDCPS